MRRLLGLALLAASAAAPAADRLPPAPHCLDARDVAQVRRVADDVLSVETSAGFFRVGLAEACTTPGPITATSLISPEGWACGREDEYIRIGHRICGIATVQPLAPAAHARLLRESDQIAYLDAVMLGTLEVEGKRPRNGFAGTTEYCFSPRFVRSWSENKQGLVVETSPERAGGNRHYQVELEGSCSQLTMMHQLQFRSGVGIGVICGNPGDMVLGARIEAAAPEPFAQPAASTGMPATAGCAISAVYPLADASTAQP